MKKMVITLALLVAASFAAQANSIDWGIWKGVSLPGNVDSAGSKFRLGLVWASSSGTVNGFQFTPLGVGATSNVNGLSMAWLGVNWAESTRGVQVSFLNYAAQKINGGQLGFINYTSDNSGLQSGFLNIADRNGSQIGLINVNMDSPDFQFGLVNYASNNALFQLGLININVDGWLPVMIFVNFSD